MWPFFRDVHLYALLGLLVGFAAFVLLVSAVQVTKWSKALSIAKTGLSKFQSAIPSAATRWATALVGVPFILVLLGYAMYLLARMGDFTMPATSAAVGHFGNPIVAWQSDNPEEWNGILFRFREVSGIKGDQDQWEDFKRSVGLFDIRMYRALFWCSLLVVTAGVIDCCRRKFIGRGASAVVIGVVLMFGMQAAWINRTEQFIRNVIAQYESACLASGVAAVVADSYPGFRSR
jgi:hypothetical protein